MPGWAGPFANGFRAIVFVATGVNPYSARAGFCLKIKSPPWYSRAGFLSADAAAALLQPACHCARLDSRMTRPEALISRPAVVLSSFMLLLQSRLVLLARQMVWKSQSCVKTIDCI